MQLTPNLELGLVVTYTYDNEILHVMHDVISRLHWLATDNHFFCVLQQIIKIKNQPIVNIKMVLIIINKNI